MTRRRPPGPKEPPSYAVGYGRPPTASRFRAGVSGNAGGRPRKSQAGAPRPASDVDRMVLREAGALIDVTIDGKKSKIPTQQALMKRLLASGLQGDHRAGAAFVRAAGRAQAKIDAEQASTLRAYEDYVTAWNEEAGRRAAARPRPPQPAPHPDDFVPDLERGRVLANGPLTEGEAVVWRAQRAKLPQLNWWISLIEGRPDLMGGGGFRDTLRKLRAERDLVLALYPSTATRRGVGFDLTVWRLHRLRRFAASKPPEPYKSHLRASRVIKALTAAVRSA
jgi:hypothetical protein